MIEAGRARPARTLPLRPFAFVVVAAALAGVIGGVALHRLRAAATSVALALPELHGQAVWAAGERPAPPFTLRDQRGVSVSLGALRGQVHQWNGIPLIVTYHPAALLRNPDWKRPAWDDLRTVRQLLDRRT